MSARRQAPDPLEEALVDYLWARHAKRRGAAAASASEPPRIPPPRSATPWRAVREALADAAGRPVATFGDAEDARAAAACVNAVARTFSERAAAPAGRAHHCEAESVVATRPLTDEEFLARAGVYECARCGGRFPVVSSGNPRRLSALGVCPRPRRRAVVGGRIYCEKCAPKRRQGFDGATYTIEYAAAPDPDKLR